MKKCIICLITILTCLLLVVLIISPLRPDDCKNSITGISLDDDEDLVFFPSMAEYDRTKRRWRVAVHAWVHEPETESFRRNALISVLQKELGLSGNDGLSRHFESMARYLMVDQKGGKDIAVTLGSLDICIGTTDRNGHARSVVALGDQDISQLIYSKGRERYLPVSARISLPAPRTVTGAIRVIDENSVMVISDIDDTIKVSNVRDKKELMRNTFVEPFRPVAGMARLYTSIADCGAVFHYVSASPWQLYRPMAKFLDRAGFPDGLFYMKSFGLSQNFSNLFTDSYSVKIPYVSELIVHFKEHRFILIGDTGESDPEMYGESALLKPGSILGIYIRNVTGETRDSPRIKKAFENVPDDMWVIFDEAADIEKDIMRRIGVTRSRNRLMQRR